MAGTAQLRYCHEPVWQGRPLGPLGPKSLPCLWPESAQLRHETALFTPDRARARPGRAMQNVEKAIPGHTGSMPSLRGQGGPLKEFSDITGLFNRQQMGPYVT